jgi:hypothetical protein
MNIASSRVAFLKSLMGAPKVWEGYYLVASKHRVWHTMALPFRFKIFKGKRRIMEIQILHHVKIQSSKKSSKRNVESIKIS